MTISTSHASYEDCFDLFIQALENPNGIRVEAEDYGAGHQLYTRLQYARTLDRDNNKGIYPVGHELYGVSVYDPLVIRKPRLIDDAWWVYIEPRRVNGKVEAL